MTQLDRDIRISTVGRDDYPELEGELVTIHDRFIGEDITGVVVGCNRSIGVTVVAAEDKDNYLLCFPGPSAPGGIMDAMLEDMEAGGTTYDEAFDFTVQCILDGEWTGGDIADFVAKGEYREEGTCDGSLCAYQQ